MTFSQEWERMRPLGEEVEHATVWGHHLARSFDPQAYCFERMLGAVEASGPPAKALDYDRAWKRRFIAPARECAGPGFEEVQSALESAWELAKHDRMKEGIVMDSFDRIAPLPNCPIGSAGWGMHLFEYRRIISEKKLREQMENFQGERYMGPTNAT